MTLLISIMMLVLQACSASKPVPPEVTQIAVNLAVFSAAELSCSKIPQNDKAASLKYLDVFDAELAHKGTDVAYSELPLSSNSDVSAAIWYGIHSGVDALDGLNNEGWVAIAKASLPAASRGCRAALNK